MSIEGRREEREIDGFRYSVVPLTTAAGLKALDRFKDVAAPLIASAVAASKNLEQAAADALKALPSVLKYTDVEYFQGVFGNTTTILQGDKRIPLDVRMQELHFAGRYMALFDWLRFCMEVNFSGFFGELRVRASAALEAAKASTPTGSTSTTTDGSSAES